jgi:exonuclease SbcD
VTLIDTVRPEAAMDRLRNRFPHILTLEFKPEGVTADGRSYGARVKGRDDLTIAAEFVQHVRSAPATPAEHDLLAAAFEAVRDEAC